MNSSDETIRTRIADSIQIKFSRFLAGKATILDLGRNGNVSVDLQQVPDNLQDKSIEQYSEWIKSENIDPLGTGIYAIRDVLQSRDLLYPLEELAEAVITLDIACNILRPGDEVLKSSLFSLTKVFTIYSQDLPPKYDVASIDPAEICKLNTPLVANLDGEFFVSLMRVDGDSVHCNISGSTKIIPKAEFDNRATRFVLAPDIQKNRDVFFEMVPEAMQAYVWG